MRPTRSTGPPAGNGTTMVTGRVGQVCACAGQASTQANAAAMIAFNIVSSEPSSCRPREGGDDTSSFRGDDRTTSVRADAGGLDHLAPALDLLRQIFREIFGRALLRRQDLEPEILEPLADGGIIDGVAHHFVELAHDRIGG